MSTHHSNLNAESISFERIEDKTTIVDGQKVPYKIAKFSYDHEDEEGNVTTGGLSFDMPELKIPYGLTLEKGYNLKGRFDFDRESVEASQCVASVARTQTKGWVRKSDVDIEMDVGSCSATPKDADAGVEVYSTPNGEVVTSCKDTMNVIGKSPDKEFLSVVFGGTDGFFEKLRKRMSELVYENRSKFSLADKSEEEILKMISDPVYIAKDKGSGKALDRNPGVYFNVIYYPYRPATETKDAMRESLARFELPGSDDLVGLDILTTKSITCAPTVKLLHLTKSGSKLSMKLAVTGACVLDIEDIKKAVQSSKNHHKYSQNTALVDKLKAKMAKVKSETPMRVEAPVVPEVDNTAPVSETTDEFSLDTMLNADAPTLDAIDLG